MSAAEETLRAKELPGSRSAPIVNRLLDFVSSVRFGVTLLIVLVVLSMVGMLVIQQNVDGFDSYFASLTPAEQTVYGALGLFDIYHSWYFNLLLLVLSLNIILASIDHFPSAWSYISKPKTWATKPWLLEQKPHTIIKLESDDEKAVAERVAAVFAANGLKARVTENASTEYAVDDNGNKIFDRIVSVRSLCVFGESGRINRLGAYIVHVALLTLFLGHFVALQTGFDADIRMVPGEAKDKMQQIRHDMDKTERFDVQVPFTMTCTDIQQKLIDPNGSIDITNTLDWRTQLKIDDPEYGTTVADISMNQPFSYRGYRFFQAQTIPIGNARKIDLELTPQNGGETQKVSIPRLGSATLADGTVVEYSQFLPDFTFNAQGQPDTRSGEYENPVAVLNVTPPNAVRMTVYAFAKKLADNIPVGAPKAGYKWRLAEFEKSPYAHVLSVKYDPYNGAFIAWYFGGFGLVAALCFVFFMSHRRIWALIGPTKEDGSVDVVVGGHTNRNHAGFEDKFNKIVHSLDDRKEN